jgi:hypothetical protein
LTAEEQPEVEAWWDRWLDRAVGYGSVKPDAKGDFLERGKKEIAAAVGNENIKAQALKIQLDKLIRDANPGEDKVPPELRVPDDQAKGSVVEPLGREDFHKDVDTDAGKLSSIAHTLHHKISDAVLRALAARLHEAMEAKDNNALEFYKVLNSQARYGVAVDAKLKAPKGDLPGSREIYNQMTNMPLNLEVGPKAEEWRNIDNDPGSLFDPNTVDVDTPSGEYEPEPKPEVKEVKGKQKKKEPVKKDPVTKDPVFSPALSVRAPQVPWDPKRRRLSVRSEALFKISFIGEKAYLNKKYTPTTEDWATMTSALKTAVAEHNRLLKGQDETKVKLTNARMGQWYREKERRTGRMRPEYFRKQTEEGLVYAHDYKRAIGDAGEFSQQELEQAAALKEKQREADRQAAAVREAENRQREQEMVDAWMSDRDNLDEVHQVLLGDMFKDYADEESSTDRLLVYIAKNRGALSKNRKRSDLFKDNNKDSKETHEAEWLKLKRQTAKELWVAAGKPGLTDT